MYEYKVVIKRLEKLSEGLEVNDDLGWKLISLLQNQIQSLAAAYYLVHASTLFVAYN